MNLSKEAEGALRAMKRAVRAAQQLAAEKNLKIPIWQDGAVVYIEPTQMAEGGGAER